MDKKYSLQHSIFLACSFVLLIWFIKLFESAFGVSFSHMGVYPQTASGFFGILTAPLIHGSFNHTLANTLPVLLLGSMLFYGYPRSRWWVLSAIWILSGLGVWLFARSSYHIGASGITHGLFFYLFIAGIIRRDPRSSALLMIAFFMYGTMFWTIFPQAPDISFEYHLFGALSGAGCAIRCSHWDPLPVEKKYSWEIETAENELDEEDPVIGDQWKTAVNEHPEFETAAGQYKKVF